MGPAKGPTDLSQLHPRPLQAIGSKAERLHNRGVSVRFEPHEPFQAPCITPGLQTGACRSRILYGLTAHHAFLELPACGLVSGLMNSRRVSLHNE